jgi:orotate phosphoribosyltransferase
MNLAAQIYRCSRLQGTFTLRSGAVSDTYFDKFQFEADPQLLRKIAGELVGLIPEGAQVLAGLEMGGIPIVTLMSQLTNLPTAFIRKEPKRYGTCRYAEGAALGNKSVVLVEDVVSSGGALVAAIDKLHADRIAVHTAICVIDRLGGGRQALADAGVELRALLTMNEIEAAGSTSQT